MLSDLLQNIDMSKLGRPIKRYQVNVGDEEEPDIMQISKYKRLKGFEPTNSVSNILLHLMAGYGRRR